MTVRSRQGNHPPSSALISSNISPKTGSLPMFAFKTTFPKAGQQRRASQKSKVLGSTLTRLICVKHFNFTTYMMSLHGFLFVLRFLQQNLADHPTGRPC